MSHPVSGAAPHAPTPAQKRCPCGLAANGNSEHCCTACPRGRHTTACAIRQFVASPPRPPRRVMGVRLMVVRTIGASVLALIVSCADAPRPAPVGVVRFAPVATPPAGCAAVHACLSRMRYCPNAA
jgi:hypothetical protein